MLRVRMRKRVAYITNIAPHYRLALWKNLLQDKDVEFHFFYGGKPVNGIRQMVFEDGLDLMRHQLHQVRNIRIGSVLVYQLGVVCKVLTGKYDAYILLGDMYVLSNWLAALIGKLKGKKIFLWGHGIYGNEMPLKLFLRKTFLSLGDGHFLYGNYAKRLMIKHGFDERSLHVVFNSLQYDIHSRVRNLLVDPEIYPNRKYFANNFLPILIFIGRLTEKKGLTELVKAVEQLRNRNIYVNLLLIGDGSQRQALENAAAAVAGQVHFFGACYDEHEIGRLLANATLCVSPGNVGLTAIHSLSFGTPVCTHDDMTQQMPEAEAVKHGQTGILYDRRNDNLDVAIEHWLSQPTDREEIRRNCYRVIDTYYNPHVQHTIFRKALLHDK
jgi:glycosyltransferase involved in cell wall biosynthesis